MAKLFTDKMDTLCITKKISNNNQNKIERTSALLRADERVIISFSH